MAIRRTWARHAKANLPTADIRFFLAQPSFTGAAAGISAQQEAHALLKVSFPKNTPPAACPPEAVLAELRNPR